MLKNMKIHFITLQVPSSKFKVHRTWKLCHMYELQYIHYFFSGKYCKISKILFLHSLFKCYVHLYFILLRKEKIYWNMIVKKNIRSSISFICLVIMPCSYSETKVVIQAIFSFFSLVPATSFDFFR